MEDRSLQVTIGTSTIVKTIGLLLLLWLLYILRGIVLDVLAAIVLASAIEPGVAALKRNKVPRVLGVVIVYIAFFFVFFGVFLFVLPSLFADLAKFISSLPLYLNVFSQAGGLDQYANLLGIPKASSISTDEIMASIRSSLDLGVFGNAFGAASRIFGGVFSFIIIVVFSFYFAVIETGVDDFLRIVVPKSHQSYALDLWRRSQNKIGLWMQGQLILAVLMGVLVFLALTLFQVPHALVLALIAAVFEIIPVFGPTLAAIPAVIVAFVSGGASLGAITIAIYVIAQQFENHLIYPQVVTRVVGVPPLLVILALIIGADLAGFLGVILSVPVAATIQELVRDIENDRLPKAQA